MTANSQMMNSPSRPARTRPCRARRQTELHADAVRRAGEPNGREIVARSLNLLPSRSSCTGWAPQPTIPIDQPHASPHGRSFPSFSGASFRALDPDDLTAKTYAVRQDERPASFITRQPAAQARPSGPNNNDVDHQGGPVCGHFLATTSRDRAASMTLRGTTERVSAGVQYVRRMPDRV